MNKKSFERLCSLADEITNHPATRENKHIGYMPNFMGRICIPRSKVTGNEYIQVNGNIKLTIISPSDIGLPYGPTARILLIIITTLAKINNSNEIYLGKTQKAFMASLGKFSSGGLNGSNTGTIKQLQKLLISTFLVEDPSSPHWGFKRISVANDASLWTPFEDNCWNSHLHIGTDDYYKLTKSAIPIDMRVIYEFKGKSLAIDIYLLLVRILPWRKSNRLFPWSIIEQQLGMNYKNVRNFRRDVIKNLKLVHILYPQAKIKITKEGLELDKSPPHVPR